MSEQVVARIVVRPSTYRGRSGFSVYGTDTFGRRVRVFARTQECAELWRTAFKSGSAEDEALASEALLEGK